MSRNNLLSAMRKHKLLFQRARSRRRSRQRSAPTRRTARFEPLEARLTLSADLGFAGAFCSSHALR